MPACYIPGASLRWDVVCGSDFSETSLQASQAAATIAERLTLVHAVNEGLHKGVSKESRDRLMQSVQVRLCDEQEKLRAPGGVSVETSVCVGKPATVLLGEANARCATLIVVGASRPRAGSIWTQQTIAEVVAETATIPTLIIREAASFRQWSQGERRLRIFIGTDFSAPSESALLWVGRLCSLGPSEVFAGFLETGPIATRGDETVPSLFMNEMVLKAAHTQELLFESRVRKQFGLSHVHTRFEKNSGNSAGKLVQLAAQDAADIIVIGTHSRRGWRRIGHRSVSRFVLRCASTNVLVCPGRVGA